MGIRLSASQRKVVDHNEGALLVVAGPGSGKTRVLTERIRRLLTDREQHFRILALTFTNKAANEMKERLQDVPNIGDRAFIGTIHSFCTEVLVQKGKSVGIDGMPQILETYTDQISILSDAVDADPDLFQIVRQSGDAATRKKTLSDWLKKIARFKNDLLLPLQVPNETDRKVYDAYQDALTASGAVDFEDLLLLTYHLLIDRPKVAAFFRRLYKYICVDEGQDMNLAQYRIICALTGDDYNNVMIVGDPEQSIYGFATADPKYLREFRAKYNADEIKLMENFRSAERIVEVSRTLKPNYTVKGELAVQGEVSVKAAENEAEEADYVIDTISRLIRDGHKDVEGVITLERCAVLCRSRYGLLNLEDKLKETDWKYYKQWSAKYENVSSIFEEFDCCLRILANPRNQLHSKQLLEKWNAVVDRDLVGDPMSGLKLLTMMAANSVSVSARVCLDAIIALQYDQDRLLLPEALDVLTSFGDDCDIELKRAIYEDARVLSTEWDKYLRSNIGGSQDLRAFLTHTALGTTKRMLQEGLALITIHSAKGLEFDVVFIVGMAEGTFPDYRALKSPESLEEEKRSAFVSVSRSKRLLYLSYPKLKVMPWGDTRSQQPSRFIRDMGL